MLQTMEVIGEEAPLHEPDECGFSSSDYDLEVLAMGERPGFKQFVGANKDVLELVLRGAEFGPFDPGRRLGWHRFQSSLHGVSEHISLHPTSPWLRPQPH